MSKSPNQILWKRLLPLALALSGSLLSSLYPLQAFADSSEASSQVNSQTTPGAPGAANLQEQTARIDDTPPSEVPKPPKNVVHQLQASRDESGDTGGSSARPSSRIEIRGNGGPVSIIINSPGSISIGGNLSALRDLLGQQVSMPLKALAERDTEYGVCGVALQMQPNRKGYVSILQAYPGLPAGDGGIRSGDQIVSVNGQCTLDIPPADVWSWFTGKPNTRVDLVVLRDGQQFPVSLLRLDIGHIKDDRLRTMFLMAHQTNGDSRFMNDESSSPNRVGSPTSP